MPLDFGIFLFASPPRTATTWIKHAADMAGLRGGGRVHDPHSNDSSRIKLSTVRHPAEWLRSYWAAIWPAQIQVDLVDDLYKACCGAETFDEFIRLYLKSSWRIGGMIAGYGADVVIRVEDLPWAFINFLEPFMSPQLPEFQPDECLFIPHVNESRKVLPRWNPSLKAKVLEAEHEMIEKYEY